MTLDEILTEIRAFNVPLVEITGGEPLAQPAVFELITRLCDENFEVLIETGGYFSTEKVDCRAAVILDVKCPASGESERNYWANLEILKPAQDEVKFVVADKADLRFAAEIIKKYDLENRAKAVLISPVFGIDYREIAAWTAASAIKNARLNLQIHKFVWGADVHGV
jgi:7-carboxy-7-deazaguanine synthase